MSGRPGRARWPRPGSPTSRSAPRSSPAWTTRLDHRARPAGPGGARHRRRPGRGGRSGAAAAARPGPPAPACPRCGSTDRRGGLRFGATACTALYRCTRLRRAVRPGEGAVRQASGGPSTRSRSRRWTGCATTPSRSPSRSPTSCADGATRSGRAVAHRAPDRRRRRAPPRRTRSARRPAARPASAYGEIPGGLFSALAGRRGGPATWSRCRRPTGRFTRRPGRGRPARAASPPARASRRCCRSPPRCWPARRRARDAALRQPAGGDGRCSSRSSADLKNALRTPVRPGPRARPGSRATSSCSAAGSTPSGSRRLLGALVP